jgi:hypothetical protein
LWGLVAPPTKVESEQTAHLEHLETLVGTLLRENQGRNTPTPELKKFIDARGLEQEYPLAYALFYSNGRKTLYYGPPNSMGVIFDPASIKVASIKNDEICLSGFTMTISELDWAWEDNACFAFGSLGIEMRIQSPKSSLIVGVHNLGGSTEGAAWVIGVKPG